MDKLLEEQQNLQKKINKFFNFFKCVERAVNMIEISIRQIVHLLMDHFGILFNADDQNGR